MEDNILILEQTHTNTHLALRNFGYSFTKRVVDILVSFVAVLFLAFIMLAVKIAFLIKGDFGPVIYTCNRIGKDGKIFRMFKFRTMIPDASKKLEELLNSDEELKKEYELNHKLENDPRITKVGKFLRDTSIDELPQLINVLLGDMTLVGNRPYNVEEKEDMGLYFNDIVKTKPGITGIWQVSGRSNTTFLKRLQLEKMYSNNYNLKLDIKILFRTFAVVLKKDGAK